MQKILFPPLKFVYFIFGVLVASLVVFMVIEPRSNQGDLNLNQTFNPMNSTIQYQIIDASYSLRNPTMTQRFTPSEQEGKKALQMIIDQLGNNSNLYGLEKYKMQFFGYRDSNNDSIIWANAFCENDDLDWRKDIIEIMDGGKCYFNVKINLNTEKIFDLSINGEA